jgi:hypothetical protein
LHDLDEAHAFRNRGDELVEQMHDLRTRALQLRNDLHACQQPFPLAFQARDLFDLFVELGNFRAKNLIAALLRARPTLDRELGQIDDAGAYDQGAGEGDEKFLLALLAQLGTPGQ